MRCVLILFLSAACFAAGGSCPNGTNYPNASGALVTLASLGVTSCYYASSLSGASDSNSGTSESSPWLHIPGMPTCTATCGTVQSAGVPAGTGIIIEGGSTYHFGNSSATPYAGGGGINFTWSGTSSHYTYIGVDLGWPSTGWTRPVFTGDNSPSTSVVGSCAYQVTNGNDMVAFSGTVYNILDDFEFTGFCWNTTQSSNEGGAIMLTFNSSGSPNGHIVSRNYVHGWTHTSAGTQGGGGIAFYSYNQEPGITYEYNVIDGSDSDPYSLISMKGDVYQFNYNVVRYNQGENSSSGCYRVHDNLWEYMNNVTDGSSHSDVLQCYGETSHGSSDPNLFYNNIFRYIGTLGSQALSANTLWLAPPTGQTDYVFNNVIHDLYANSNYFNISQASPPIGGGNVAFYNNTFVNPPFNSAWPCPAPAPGSVSSQNNHWITTYTSTMDGCSFSSETTDLFMTPTLAATQGYTSANDYAPTASSNSTVGAGTNNATFCNGLNDSVSKAACLQGFTGVAYNATNHTVVVPAILGVNRPSTGAWNVGAYQFAATGPNAPTGLTVTVH
jgi:hypothetical protein